MQKLSALELLIKKKETEVDTLKRCTSIVLHSSKSLNKSNNMKEVSGIWEKK